MNATEAEAATRDRRRFSPELGPLESRLAPMGCAAAPAEHDPMGCPPPSSVGG